MNWTAAFLLFSLLPAAAHVQGQGTITLTEKNTPLSKVLAKIQQQSGYTIWCEKGLLETERSVTLQLDKVSVETAMQACLAGRSLSWSFVGQMIVVKAIILAKPAVPDSGIHGRVVNDKGEPIAGATILVKARGRSFISDENGRFHIPGMGPGISLFVSSVGHASKELIFEGQQPFVIPLLVAVNRLDEVQVIGYGMTTRRNNTGSVATLSKETIAQQPVSNALLAASGRLAGVQIVQSNGLPGSPVTVQVRGQNSIAAGNNPLFVVDGVPFPATPIELMGGPNASTSGLYGNPLNALSPSDIESIQVLKDADATAIYGSRAANGVVLITTRKGNQGKTRLDLNYNMGAGQLTRLAPTLDTRSYLQLRRTAFTLDGITPTVTNAPDLLVWDSTQYQNWQDYFYGNTAQTYDGQATLSGGNGATNFRMAANFHEESSVLNQSDRYQRTSFQLSLDHASSNKKFQLALTAFYTPEKYIQKPRSTLRAVMALPPNFPAWDNQGNIYWWAGLSSNPFANQLKFYHSTTGSLNSNLVLRFTPVPLLNFKINLGYNLLSNEQISGDPAKAQNPAGNPKGSSSFSNQRLRTFLVEPQVSYQFTAGRHHSEILAGATYQQTDNNGDFILAGNYSSDDLLQSLSDGTVQYKFSNIYQYKYLSVFSRLQYLYRQQFLVNLNFRRDGSTRFGPGQQFGNFGSVGAAWIFSNQSLVKQQMGWLSYGKLRGSYGTTGNDPNTDYGFLSTYTTGTAYGSVTSLVPARIANPAFQWEVNRKLELALELGFWKDRILLTGAWYQNRADNQLVGYPLPATSGFTSYQANLENALVENTGVEIELNTVNIDKKDFRWTTSLNGTFPRNSLVSFPGIERTAYAGTYVVGQPLSIVQKFHFLGVDPSTGIARIDDINKDNILTSRSSYNGQGGDYTIAGYTAPRFFGGLGNTLRFKQWQLDFFIQYVQQEAMNLVQFYTFNGILGNSWPQIGPYWSVPGQETIFPRPTSSTGTPTYPATSRFANSDAGFSDASYLRLKNVAVAYHFPIRWTKALRMAHARVYLQGQNVATWTSFKGYDPETPTSASDIGVPPMRNFVFGFQCTF